MVWNGERPAKLWQTHDVEMSEQRLEKSEKRIRTDCDMSAIGGRLHHHLQGCHILLVANKTRNSGPFCPDTLSMKFSRTFRCVQSLRRIVIEEIDLDAGLEIRRI
jgi:hypothetical protein